MYGRPVNLGNPVSDHPLNRGLVLLLQTLPNLTGGRRWRNATGRAGELTLLSGAGWYGFHGCGITSVGGTGIGTATLPATIDTSTGGSELSVELVATWFGADSGTANISGLWRFGNYSCRLGNAGIRNTQPQFNGSGTITSGSDVAAGVPFHLMVAGKNATGFEMFLNGVSVGTQTYTANSGSVTGIELLVDDTGGRNGSSAVRRVAVYQRRVTAEDAGRLYRQYLAGYPDTLRRVRPWSFGASAGNPVTVTPGTASLTLTTFAPTVSTPRLVTPPTATLTLTAFAPTVLTPRTATPGTASLTLTAFAPSVLTPRLVTPGTAALSLTAFAASVSTPRVVVPGAAALTLTGYAPTVGGSATATPGTAALVVTLYAPTVTVAPLVPPAPTHPARAWSAPARSLSWAAPARSLAWSESNP